MMDKTNSIIIKIKIDGQEFSLEKKAYNRLSDYLDSIDEFYAKDDGKEEIIADMHSRITEVLAEKKKSRKHKIIVLEQVNAMVKRLGEVKAISEHTPEAGPQKTSFKRIILSILRIFAYIAYWLPHGLWLFYIFGSAAYLFGSILTGPERLTFITVATYFVLTFLPFVFIVIGGYLTVKKRLRSMLILMFGVEIPVFLLSFFRIFIFQNISGPINIFYIAILFACFGLILEETKWRVLKRNTVTEYIRLAGLGLGSLLTGYILVIWSLFFPYVAKGIIVAISDIFEMIFSTSPYSHGFISPMVFLPVGLVIFSIMLVFYFSPVYAFLIYFIKFVKKLKQSLVPIANSISKKNNTVLHNLKALDYVKPFAPFISIALLLVLVAVSSIDYSRIRKNEVQDAVISQGSYNEMKSKYLKLYDFEDITKYAIKDEYFLVYSKLFDNNSKDMFNSLYCVNIDHKNVYYRPGNDDAYFTFDQSVCDGLYSIFSALVYPVVHNGDIIDDHKLAAEQYKKVFDDDIQRAEKNDINQYISNTFSQSLVNGRVFDSSMGTAKLLNEDQKNVLLTDLDVQTEIDTNKSIYKSVYTFSFENKESTNQEVHLEFSIPDDAIITDLRLGINLDKFGIIAPKAAAKEVYDRSLVRNIDPALLELVGPRTYRLRVFPVPFASFEVTNKQRVQFTVAGVIYQDFELITFPYARNLDLNQAKYKASIIFVNSPGANLDSIEGLDVLTVKQNEFIRDNPYIYESREEAQKDIEVKSPVNLKGFSVPPCYFKHEQDDYRNAGKIRIFFDFSKSAEDNRDEYMRTLGELIASANGDNLNFDIYEFNFRSEKVFENETDTEKIFRWLETNEFWGYTDKSKIAKNLIYTDNYPAMTIIFTDDSDFEFTSESDYGIDYSVNKSRIDLYQFGERLTAQKEEINNLVLGSGGNVYLVSQGQSIRQDLSCKGDASASSSVADKVILQIIAFNNTGRSIGQINGSSSRILTAKQSFANAKIYYVVDAFNSMIAVDNDWQKNQLATGSKKKDAFDEKFDIGSEDVISSPNSFGLSASMPEGDLVVMQVIAAVFGLAAVVIYRRRSMNSDAGLYEN